MKKTGTVVLATCALLSGIVVSGVPRVNSFVKTIHANCSSATTLWADGSAPTPPLPPPPGSSLAAKS